MDHELKCTMTIKRLKGEYLLGLGEELLYLVPKCDPLKEKWINWTSATLKTVLQKTLLVPIIRAVNRMKRQTKIWQKILANQISNKGYISRISKELSKKLNNK